MGKMKTMVRARVMEREKRAFSEIGYFIITLCGDRKDKSMSRERAVSVRVRPDNGIN